MESKRITQLVVVLIAAAIIVFAYLKLSEPQGEQGNPLNVIPSTSQIICSIDGFGKSDVELEFLHALLEKTDERSCYVEWQKLIATMDSLRKSNREWYDLLQQSSIAFTTQDPFSPGNWSVIVALHSKANAEELMSVWMPQLPVRNFKGTDMRVGKDLSWCLLQHCLIVSPAAAAIEDIIINTNSGDVLASSNEFNEAYELRSKDVPLHFCAKVSDGAWLQLDPIFQEHGSALSGYLTQSDNNAHALHVATDGVGEMTIHNTLPENTIFLDAIAAADADSLWHSLSLHFEQTDAAKFWSQAWQDIGDSCQCDLNEILLSWRNGEMGSAVIDIADSATAAVAYIGIRDTIDVITLMQPLLVDQGPQADGIYKVKFPAAFERNLAPVTPVECNYITTYKNFVFIASTPAQLNLIRNSSASLSNHSDFKRCLQQHNPEAARFIYQASGTIALLPSAINTLVAGCGSFAIDNEWVGNNRQLISIALPIQSSKAIASVAPPEKIEISEPVSTDIPAQGQTWTVVNHNTNEKETLRSDGQSMTLLDAAGKTLWNLSDLGPVLGDVIQIDALKNNKLQYAFTTAKGLFIIDRNGNNLTGFPYLPKPPTTSTLLAADYDNTKKYRLIFAMGDDMLVNMGVDGKPTSGWKYQPKNMGAPIVAVETAKVGNDDVLFVVSSNGAIQLLKRTGEVKANCSTILESYNGGAISVVPGNDLNSTSIVYRTAAGEQTAQISAQ